MKLNKSMKHVFEAMIFAVAATGFFACGNDNSMEELRNNELAKLDTYMEKNYPGVEPTSSGLYFIEVKKGTGDTIKNGDQVQIYYATWMLKDSFLLDQSVGYLDGYRYEPYTVNVGSGASIAGLEEALTMNMQKGSVANLVIDSKLAYGQNGNTNNMPYVPGFTTLLMQIEVYKIYKAN